MTQQEVSSVITLIKGVPQLIVKLLYGSGLRMIEGYGVTSPLDDINLIGEELKLFLTNPLDELNI